MRLYACKARQVKNKLFIDFYPCWVTQISVPVFPVFSWETPNYAKNKQRTELRELLYSLSYANNFGEMSKKRRVYS